MKSTTKYMVIFLALIMTLTVSGAFAVWIYTSPGGDPTSAEMGISLSVFDYTPDEILPGGSNEEAELGGDHFALIQLILYEDDKDYGLNINKNALIHQYLRSNSVVYSNQKISGGNLKFILDPQNNTHGLYYCIAKVSDTEYLCYTYAISDLATVCGTEVEMPAYRTTLLKTDGVWQATTSYLGYVKTASLSDLGESADPHTIAYAIDISTWHY